MTIRAEVYRNHYRTVVEERLGLPVSDSDLGLRVQFDSGLKVVIEDGHAARDPEFLCVTAIFGKDHLDEHQLQAVVGRVSSRIKMVKAVVRGECITLHAQVVNSAPDTLPPAEHLVATLPRVFSALEAGANALHEELVFIKHAAELGDIDLTEEA